MGPVIYVSQEGGGELRLLRFDDGAWNSEVLTEGSMRARADIAARGARIGVTGMDAGLDVKIDLFYVEPGGTPQVLARHCSPSGGSDLAFDSHGPVVVTVCNDELIIFDTVNGTWRKRYSEPDDGSVLDIAIDAEDRVHVWKMSAGTAVHESWAGTKKTVYALPAEQSSGALGECGGRIYGTFYRVGLSDGSSVSFGELREASWVLEVVERGTYQALRLGFDEQCRPFLAAGMEVWSRAAAGWIHAPISRSQIDSFAIDGLVAYRGTLYAAYEEHRDGTSVGIATAPLLDADAPKPDGPR